MTSTRFHRSSIFSWMVRACWALLVGLPGLPSLLGAEIQLSHYPVRPRSGESVSIRVNPARPLDPSKVVLEYQVVVPGNFIDKSAAGFARGWVALSLTNTTSPIDSLTATIPSEVQKHRRLIRYRVRDITSKTVVAPAPVDSCPNEAYFVYDGIPAWRASIKPKDKEEEFSAELMSSVQAYHLIATTQSVEGAMWKEQTGFGSEDASEYRWSGALVGADGTVYDHIRFRPRGGCWRYAMGKNMWKFDFNKGRKFRAEDDWGRPYQTRWSKLNLGACIQQGDYGMRGEQGLFEATGFRLFNLAGLPSPKTHFVQLRVITEADEKGKNQYAGDFWGLYLAVENVDDNFVKEHGLPDQSVFKVDNMQPHWGKQGADKLTEADAAQFVQSIFSQPTETWWRKNVNLPEYYSYRSILEAIHHYDIDSGKNYFFRRDPLSQRWSVVPWDIDLSWGDQMYGGGREPFYQAGALRHGKIRIEYQNRLRELRDLLFNPEQTGALIDEYTSLIATRHGGLTFAEADRRKWDYHPIHTSPYAMGGMKTGPGLFYAASPSGDIFGMAQLMKRYVGTRGRQLDQRWLANPSLPPKPKLAADSIPKTASESARVHCEIQREGVPLEIQWHLGDVTPPNKTPNGKRHPRNYEVATLWSTNGPTAVEIPSSVLRPGHTYRLRARFLDTNGASGHYSSPVEFTVAP